MKGKINNQGQLEILRPRVYLGISYEYLLVNCINGNYCDDKCVYFGEPFVAGIRDLTYLPLCKKDLIFEELIDERVILKK